MDNECIVQSSLVVSLSKWLWFRIILDGIDEQEHINKINNFALNILKILKLLIECIYHHGFETV